MIYYDIKAIYYNHPPSIIEIYDIIVAQLGKIPDVEFQVYTTNIQLLQIPDANCVTVYILVYIIHIYQI